MSLKEKYLKLLEDARAIADQAVSEDRGFTEDEKIRVNNMLEEAKQLKADYELAEQLNSLGDLVGESHGKPQRKFSGSIADSFVNNEAYKAWFKSLAPNGYLPESAKGLHSPAVDVKSFGLFKKDLITGASDTSAGAFIVPQDTGIYEPLGRHPTVLRDLISVRETTSDAVEFVRQTTQVTQATPTAEANVTETTGYTGEISGEKPEGAIKFERVTEAVKTIPVWVPATKRALSDAAQIRGIIDQELRDDLADELENQMFNGDGIGENFRGIANTAGTLLQTYDTDIMRTTRKALTALKKLGKTRPTAWVFSPNDWETVELLKDKEDRYYYGGPQGQGPTKLWGVPVVESYHIASGTAWLANWTKAVLWDRQQATISVSDSHSDFFIRNMIAILAEMRAAFGLIRPSAFIEVELS
jgi:HK97 family phage major capsid protein